MGWAPPLKLKTLTRRRRRGFAKARRIARATRPAGDRRRVPCSGLRERAGAAAGDRPEATTRVWHSASSYTHAHEDVSMAPGARHPRSVVRPSGRGRRPFPGGIVAGRDILPRVPCSGLREHAGAASGGPAGGDDVGPAPGITPHACSRRREHGTRYAGSVVRPSGRGRRPFPGGIPRR